LRVGDDRSWHQPGASAQHVVAADHHAEGSLRAPMATTASTSTFLPQRSFCPLWKDGFETWHIAAFLVQLTLGNVMLLSGGYIDRPTPGKMSLDEVLTPSNEVFRLFLLTTIALFVKTHAVMWSQVWMGCKNNSFSKNVWDKNTGSPTVSARTTEQDLFKTTLHNIHGNDLENIPLTLILHACLVLVQPTVATAKLIMVTYTVARYVHTFWYSFYGSHEVRATIFSLNCACNYAAVCQLLAACDVL
jgi:uncharacterized membrane protein YecN with MAPEG domain